MAKQNETLVVALPISTESTETVKSRRMTRDDADSLVALWLASYPPEVTDGATEVEVEADWIAAFNGDYGRFLPEASLLVEEDGRVVAAVQTVVDAVWDGTPSGPFVIEVIVHPATRRRGIARALLRVALDNLDRSGFSGAALRVETNNFAAKKLYESLGFRPV